MNQSSHNSLVSFIWRIADDCLRDVYVRGKYRDVIRPMVVLRRLHTLLEPTKDAVLEEVRYQKEDMAATELDDEPLKDASGYVFFNTSQWALKKLHGTAALLELVQRVEIARGTLQLALDPGAIATQVGVEEDDVRSEPITRAFPFQLRKRGVETRIILADAPPETDDTLIRNIARAHIWFERVRAGETFDDIAKTCDTSKRRIQQMIGLAFLAPDIVREVLAGAQPVGFTSEWCLRNALPSDWTEQRRLIAAL